MINSRAGIRAMRRGLLAVFLLLTISSASQAGPLGVDIKLIPSINAGLISTSYNATTGAFGATGWALSLDTGSGPVSYSPLKQFKLVATIDSATGKASNVSLSIGDAASPLLTGLNLLGFAYSTGPGAALEFLFGTVGGSYVSSGVYSSAPDRPLDVMITLGTNNFLGNFGSNWNSTASTAQVREDPKDTGSPEPSALLLMLSGAGGLYGLLRKRISGRLKA